MTFDLLLSYAYHAKADLNNVRSRIGDGLLIIDSGAYTAHHSKTGRTISLDAYAEYLHTWDHAYTGAMTLDVVHDPAGTAANTKRLQAKGCRVMPVFQTGADLKEFDAMIRHDHYVAVGGIGGLGARDRKLRGEYVTMITRRARDLGGAVHLLGVNGQSVLRSGCYSADTSAPSKAILRGLACIYDGRRMRYEAITQSAVWHGKDRDLLLGYELPGKADPRWWKDKAYRQAVVSAGYWSFWAESQQLQRRNIPAPPGAPSPGTRIVPAVLNPEMLGLALTIADRIRANDLPRTVRNIVGTTRKEPAA